MLLIDMIVSKPVVFFLILTTITVVPPSLVLNFLSTKARTIEESVMLFTQKPSQDILSGVAVEANLLSPIHSLSPHLARTIRSSINETDLSFSLIESEVAPLLFEAFSTITYLSQVTYISRDGLLFSYYNQENQQPIGVYTNTSLFSVHEETSAANHNQNITLYSLPANRDTGKLHGVVTSHPTSIDPSSLQVVLESRETVSVGPSWIDNKDLLIFNTAVMDGIGAISLGFDAKAMTEFLSGSISNDGSLFLATKDGRVLSDTKIPNVQIVVGNNSVAFKSLNQNGDPVGDNAGSLTCQENDGTLRPTSISILETKYDAYCSEVEIIGVELIFVLTMPIEGPERSLHKHFKELYQYLLGATCVIFVITALFAALIISALAIVTQLRFALKKQVAATAQAERICITKSTNYANASHDVRASLAGIMGLIDRSLNQIVRGSDLEGNILNIMTCCQDLLDILNNILDRSKLDAGQATLEIEEFEMSHLLEDVADLFHAVGMKKGIDVVLDLNDGSVNKFDHVRGDRIKLRQILSNIVSNAVKFTSDGYVFIRAYARKPSSSCSIPLTTPNGPLSWLLSFFRFPKYEAYTESKTEGNDIRKDETCMEFIFEVDDTGLGIPKDKQATVFENYARIKNTSSGIEGTGLGLGIVQTLVRLMGGDIEIVDKEVGKKGTCFKFTTYLPLCETDQCHDIESNAGLHMSSGETMSLQNLRLSSPNVEGSQVVLFIQNEARRKICKTFMERQGVQAWVVRNCEELASSLKRMKHRTQNSSFKKSDALQSLDGSRSSLDIIGEDVPPTHTRTITKGSVLPHFVLMVIETSGGTRFFHELNRLVAEFRQNISAGCNKVVWLDMPGYGRHIQLQGNSEDKLPTGDVVITKPFHGSRLYQVLKLLPEFGGEMSEGIPPTCTSTHPGPVASLSWSIDLPLQHREIKEVDKPLSWKKVLLVEDEYLLRNIATAILSRLGAVVEISVNGEEALQTICKSLQDQWTSASPHSMPYNYIFMDCQMPVMDGIEATRRIREEEAKYGVRMPIFAVSAHTDGPEIQQMKQAGVDYNLAKPLNAAKIIEFLNKFDV